MNIKTKVIVLLLFTGILSCNAPQEQENPLKLWYDTPATDWMTEALPIGNGYMGVMFFGGVEKEQLQFSEESLWSGGPGSNPKYNSGTREGAWKAIPEVRKLLNEGKFELANELASRQLTGIIHPKEGGSAFGDYGAQQTMGYLFITVNHSGNPENYRRELDLKNSEGKVYYKINGEKYERTYFGSYPGKVMVYRFESTTETDYSIRLETPHKKMTEAFADAVYSFQGEVEDNGMQFETCLKIDTDGKAVFENGALKIIAAKNLTVYHVAATDYTLEYPTYKGNDFLSANKQALSQLIGKSYSQVRKEHRLDFQKLFSRVEINLGEINRDSIPTNQRLQEYAEGTVDPGLEQLYFQYSRYLMISATRPGTLPMHLQGKWNNSTNPPWAADYHMNINQQMLYWPAEVTNLDECHMPLFNYMESLVIPGKVTAKEFFNARGWTVNTMNNTFGYTSPGWGLPWGYFPGGAAWLCQHVWEHYAFTGDKSFLEKTAYPLMKEAALFWMDYLTEDNNGYLVSIPSYSPEQGGISMGASMDHQMAWDLLNNCVQACEVLGIDEDFKKDATEKRDRIFPPVEGSWGQLQEWKEDVDDPNNKHRHISHLFALHPGKQITTEQTPELAKAAKVSLNARGDDGTGWSLAWKVNFWARLKDGERAYQLFRRLLRPTGVAGTNYMNGGGSYANLLCAHPPFQLDGNMGGCAGIAEMLLQSHTGTIELLPALPNAWKNGSVKGLKARGNFMVNIYWNEGRLVQAEISGTPGARGTVKYKVKPESFAIPETGIFVWNFK